MSTVRVVFVDDSTFVRKALERMFLDDARIEVVGSVASGEELLENLEAWTPDVVTLDLAMPGMGGLATLDRLMEVRPLPVIVLSTHAGDGAPLTLEALHRGAADFIDKQSYSLVDFESLKEVVTKRILALAAPIAEDVPPPLSRPRRDPTRATPELGQTKALLIAASTGGPAAIERLLEGLPTTIPVPTLIVQHMPADFTSAFAERLDSHLEISVREATHGDRMRPASALVAPGGQHLTVARNGETLTVAVSKQPESSHRPSADELFASAATELGGDVVAVLLTGMGSDGARGLCSLRDAGAWTIVQDEATSVVFGMPGAAIKRGGACEILPLEEIGDRLRELLGF